MIKTIMSGGQTGVDIGALMWARGRGIPTFGYMPKGFRTEAGDKPEYALLYNMEETSSRDYRIRTAKNVANSDGTIILGDPTSRGSIVTIDACNKYHKDYHIVNLHRQGQSWLMPGEIFGTAVSWLIMNNIHILNVAGNRASGAPGIQIVCQQFLEKVYVEQQRIERSF